LGHLTIQYSKAAGFETIALSHSKDKEELAYKLGDDIVVRNGEELKNIGSRRGGGVGGGGADVILATSNSYKTIGDSLNGLRPDGRIILMGVSTTEPLIVPPDLIFRRGRIIGSMQNDREYLYEALDYVTKGKVRVITETFTLDDISNAYDMVANGKVRFRAVIKNE
jgi:alcohol dehydrogenase